MEDIVEASKHAKFSSLILKIGTSLAANIISPTISLMTDQVSKLTARGISATLIGSAQKDEDVMQKIATGWKVQFQLYHILHIH